MRDRRVRRIRRQRHRFAAGVLGAVGLVILAHTVAAQQPHLRRLGPEVNTDAREIIPLVTADGTYLYFVREGATAKGVAAAGEAAFAEEIEACRSLLSLSEDEAALIPAGSLPESEAECEDLAGQKRDYAIQVKIAMARFQRIWISERSENGWLPAERAPSPVNNLLSAWPITALPDNNSILMASAEFSSPGGCFRPPSDPTGGRRAEGTAAGSGRSAARRSSFASER